METIFYYCVQLLQWMADVTGTTYIEVNVVVFCIIEPLLFIYLLFKIRKMKKLLVIACLACFLTSCTAEFGARLGGYKAPMHRVCLVGDHNYRTY